MNLTAEVIKAKLNPFFTNQKDVVVAYLHGSFAKGATSALSDIDIGVLLDSKLSTQERFDRRLELMGDVGEVLSTDMKIDLVILEDIPLLLAFQVIHGQLLYAGDEGVRVDYETRILSRFFDQRYYIERHALHHLQHVAEKGLL